MNFIAVVGSLEVYSAGPTGRISLHFLFSSPATVPLFLCSRRGLKPAPENSGCFFSRMEAAQTFRPQSSETGAVTSVLHFQSPESFTNLTVIKVLRPQNYIRHRHELKLLL